MEEKTLVDIGMSTNEAKIYLDLLEFGESSVVDIAKRCKIHRTNIYDSIEKLKGRGLVSTLTKEGKHLYCAADPDNLLNYLKEKEVKLRDLLPRLRLGQALSKSESDVGIYEGVAANRRLLERFLKSDEEIVGYGYPKDNTKISGVWWITGFHKQRIAKKQRMLHIYNDNARERIRYLNSLPYTEAKYLPKEYNSPVSVEICGEDVLITSWEGGVISILIRNKHVARTFKNYFKLLYKIAKV